MSLVPYLVTSLSRNDITESPKDRNVVIGAIVEFRQGGVPQNIYDDAAGSNPATQKVTDSNGQLNAWVDPGVYELFVNGVTKTVVVSNELTDADKAKISTALQPSDVGTSASLDVTTSNVDSTANRVTKTGDGGFLTTATPPTLPDFDAITNPSAFYLVTSSVTNVGSRPSGFSASGVMQVYFFASGRPTQTYTDVDSNVATRFYNTSLGSWDDWVVFNTSKNTNITEFGGGFTNDVIAIGVANSLNQAVFLLYTNGYTQASSITASAGATFKIRNASFSDLLTGVTSSSINLTGGRSSRVTTLLISGFSGLTVGQTLYLCVDASGSKITVNF